MIQKLTHAPLVVSDQEKALKFYTEVLGFEKRADYQQPGKPRWLTVAPKGQDLEFILVKGDYTLDPRPPPEADSGGNHWGILTAGCRKEIETFKARGVNFKKTTTFEAPYAITAYLTHPDGNHLALPQPAPHTA